MIEKNGWAVVYERCYRSDGSLFFPGKLTVDFLEKAKQTMGSFFFANQYLSEIIPDEDKSFKKEWFKYYKTLPEIKYTFAFIDPAISKERHADFTAVVVVDVDPNNYWYVRAANKYKITPTQLVNLIFEIQTNFKCQAIGIESVAYQKALLYMLDTEMKRRRIILPLKEVKPDHDESKELRILGIQPRFEWSRIFLNNGLRDLELQLLQFPRSKHDDLADALSQIERVAYIPEPKGVDNSEPAKNSPEYEKWYLRQLKEGRDPRGKETYDSPY